MTFSISKPGSLIALERVSALPENRGFGASVSVSPLSSAAYQN
jgi:hypothetical protein